MKFFEIFRRQSEMTVTDCSMAPAENMRMRHERELKEVATKHWRMGKQFAEAKEVDRHLPLAGVDMKLVHLVIGSKLLGISINSAMSKKTGRSLRLGMLFGTDWDSPDSLKLRDEERKLREYIDRFMQERYERNLNHAWSIQRAVTDLFTQVHTDIRDKKLPKEIDIHTVKTWAGKWKEEIANPQLSPITS